MSSITPSSLGFSLTPFGPPGNPEDEYLDDYHLDDPASSSPANDIVSRQEHATTTGADESAGHGAAGNEGKSAGKAAGHSGVRLDALFGGSSASDDDASARRTAAPAKTVAKATAKAPGKTAKKTSEKASVARSVTTTQADAPAVAEAGAESVETGIHSIIPRIFSSESEELLVATILNENRTKDSDHLLSMLSADDFYIDYHAAIWQSAAALHDRNASHNIPAISDYAKSHQLQICDLLQMLSLLENPLYAHATSQSVDEAAKRVKNFAQLRRLDLILQEARQLCLAAPERSDLVLAQIQDDLSNLERMADSASQGPQRLASIIEAVASEIHDRMEGEPIAAVPSGFQAMDLFINGFSDGDLVIIAARPSMGKTAFMNNLADNIARQKIHLDRVLIFSTEMTGKSLGLRMLSSASGVNNNNLKRGELADEQIAAMMEGVELLNTLEIWIDDTPGLTLSEIRSRTRNFVRDHGRCVVMVDYLQNISSSGSKKETKDHVSECSNGLKTMARNLSIPVIALSQLNRGVEQRANKRPLMSDLRESGALEQDADLIMFLYRDEYYNADTKEPGVTEVIIAKQRDGATGTIKLSFNKQIGKFQTRYDDHEWSYG